MIVIKCDFCEDCKFDFNNNELRSSYIFTNSVVNLISKNINIYLCNKGGLVLLQKGGQDEYNYLFRQDYQGKENSNNL